MDREAEKSFDRAVENGKPTRPKRLHRVLVGFLVWIVPHLAAADDSKWIAGAKKEKQLMIYGTMQIGDMDPILEKFRANCPFLKVEYFRAGGEKLAEKLYTEVKAGKYFSDVQLQSGVEMLQLKAQGLTTAYDSPQRAFIREGLKDKEGHWTAVYLSIEALGYNTQLIPKEQVPRTYEDLLNPRWKGNLGLDSSNVEWYIIQLHNMGEERGREFMKKLVRQDVGVRRGHTLGAQLLTAGEYSLLLDFRTNHFEKFKSEGAPVGIVALGPLIPIPPVSIALSPKPPHPNAGKLFIDFLLSKEGQDLVKRVTQREVARADVAPTSALIKERGLKGTDWTPYIKRYREYETEFRDLFLKGN